MKEDDFRLMKIKEVCNYTRLCKSRVYEMMSLGEFPKNLKQGRRGRVWAGRHLDVYINCLIKGEKYDATKFAE